MINLERFDKKIKTKWLRTLLQRNWSWTGTPLKYGYEEIPRYGSEYLTVLQKRTKNPFWSSVAKTIKSFQMTFSKIEGKESFLDQPIWYNPSINIKFVQKCDKAGLRVVRDFLYENCQFVPREILERDFGFKMNFIDDATLTRSISHVDLATRPPAEHHIPWTQSYIISILSDKKSNKNIKNVFSNVVITTPTAQVS